MQGVGWDPSTQPRNSEPGTPELHPGRSGFFQFHLSTLSEPPIQVHCGSTPVSRSPPFGTNSMVPPPSLPTETPSPAHSPPITTHRPTLGKQRPILLPSPHLET